MIDEDGEYVPDGVRQIDLSALRATFVTVHENGQSFAVVHCGVCAKEISRHRVYEESEHKTLTPEENDAVLREWEDEKELYWAHVASAHHNMLPWEDEGPAAYAGAEN